MDKFWVNAVSLPGPGYPSHTPTVKIQLACEAGDQGRAPRKLKKSVPITY